jgi:uncharacterized protein YebE (UPF0316 family)
MQTVTEWLDAYPVFWPLFIILARITDVSLGTVRTICVVRGARWTAACLGFAEVIVWITAVSGVLIQPTLVKVVSYGLGFALGNACGVWMEGRLAMGQQRIVAISKNYSQAIAMALRMADYTVTEVPARRGGGGNGLSANRVLARGPGTFRGGQLLRLRTSKMDWVRRTRPDEPSRW